jgi:hypothetical protein
MRTASQNGAELAQCTCPMEKTSYSFVIHAGQGDSSACADLPVGGSLCFNPDRAFPLNGLEHLPSRAGGQIPIGPIPLSQNFHQVLGYTSSPIRDSDSEP